MAAAMFMYGSVNLRLNNPYVVEKEVGKFYQAKPALTMRAVCRAVERRDPDNPNWLPDPRVGVGLASEDGYLLVPVIFHSKLGYQYFSNISKGYLKEKMKEEFQKIGYMEPFNVGLEKWELLERPQEMYVPSHTASVADAWDILGCSPVRAGDDSYSSAMQATSWKKAPPVATVNPSPRPDNTPEPIQEYEAGDDDKERNSQKNSEEQSNEGYGLMEWE